MLRENRVSGSIQAGSIMPNFASVVMTLVLAQTPPRYPHRLLCPRQPSDPCHIPGQPKPDDILRGSEGREGVKKNWRDSPDLSSGVPSAMVFHCLAVTLLSLEGKSS